MVYNVSMESRTEKLLKEIIELYIKTAHPVGSKILFDGNNPLAFQTYESKWGGEEGVELKDVASDVQVAKLSEAEQRAIDGESVRAFKELGLRGYTRFDVRLRDGVPYILEANANSSVYDGEDDLQDPNDEVIWGIKFIDYIRKIVESAQYHFERGEKI